MILRQRFLRGTFYATISQNDQNRISQKQGHTVLNTNICHFLMEITTLYDKIPPAEPMFKRKIAHPILISPTTNTTEANIPERIK